MRPLKLLLYPLRCLMVLPTWLLLVASRRRCGRIWIVDLACDQAATSEFYDQIERALHFIRGHDPRRARWIEGHLNYITNATLIDSGGRYLKGFKSCYINYPWCREYVVGGGDIGPREQEVLTLELAQVIVHEATHARIDQRGVKYDERYRERIEKRCRREEAYFLKRTAADFTDVLGNLVDWEAIHDFEADRAWYETYWQRTRFDFVRTIVRNAVDECRETPASREPFADWKDEHRFNWESAQAHQPWTERMLISRGIYFFHAYDFLAAAADLRAVLERQPHNQEARNFLAIALYRNGEYAQALDLWLQACENGNKDVVWWISYVLPTLGRNEEALQWYDREAEEDGDEFQFLTFRAMLLTTLERYDEALAHYDQAWDDRQLELGTDDFAHRAVYALLLREMGLHERFLEVRDELLSIRDWWRECSETEPTVVDAWVLRTRDEMWQPGIVSSRAVLLICLDALEPAEWEAFFEHISAAILSAKDCDERSCDASYLRSLSRWNDNYPWRAVPESLTDGRCVYAVDMMLDRVFLPGGLLRDRRVACWIKEDDYGLDAALAGTLLHNLPAAASGSGGCGPQRCVPALLPAIDGASIVPTVQV
jgi:tetratricopeptide (TPR) repeat protein